MRCADADVWHTGDARDDGCSFQGPASPLGTQPAGMFQATGSPFLAPPLALIWVIFCSASQMLPCSILVAEGNVSTAYNQATHTRKTDCRQFLPSKVADHSGDAGLRVLVSQEQRKTCHFRAPVSASCC